MKTKNDRIKQLKSQIDFLDGDSIYFPKSLRGLATWEIEIILDEMKKLEGRVK